MRRRLALMFALCLGCAAGCYPPETVRSTTAWLPHLRPFQGPSGPDVVQMRVALIECPLGGADFRYINGELWSLADERAIDIEHQQIMKDSGFRVGQIGSQPPPRLLELLTSARANASSRGVTFRADHPRELPIGPTLPVCRYTVEGEDGKAEVRLDQADCRLSLTATVGKEGTTLRFTPEVAHGDAKQVFRGDDRTGWVSVPERPTESYPQLSWEATLAPNEYLIVGGAYDRPEALGHQFFVRPDEPAPVQRLLVIHMGAAPQEPPVNPAPSQPTAGQDAPPRSAPLALQAAWPAARGAAP
jgi:hypothetical protein